MQCVLTVPSWSGRGDDNGTLPALATFLCEQATSSEPLDVRFWRHARASVCTALVPPGHYYLQASTYPGEAAEDWGEMCLWSDGGNVGSDGEEGEVAGHQLIGEEEEQLRKIIC